MPAGAPLPIVDKWDRSNQVVVGLRSEKAVKPKEQRGSACAVKLVFRIPLDETASNAMRLFLTFLPAATQQVNGSARGYHVVNAQP